MENIKIKIHNLLRKTEKYTKTDMIYLAKGGFWVTVSQTLSSLAVFILALGFARLLSKETYGTYKYILALAGVISSFSLTGLSTAIINSVSKGFEGTLSLGFRKNLKWSIPMLLIFIGFAGYYFLEKNTYIAISLLVIAVITPLYSSAGLSDSFFTGKKDFKRSALTSGSAQLIITFSTLITAWFSKSVILLISAYMVSSLITEVIIYCYARFVYKPNNEIDDTALEYGTHLSIMGVLNGFVDKADSILTFHFLGPVDLAIYSFAIAIPEQIKGLTKSASNIAQPKFSEQNSEMAVRSMLNKILWFTGCMALIVIAYVIAAPFIYKLLFPQYTSSIFLSQIYSISLLTTASVIPTTLLQAKAKKKELYYFNVISGVLQVALIAFGLLWGLMGLIIGISVSRLFRLVYSYDIVRKKS